MTTVYPPRMTNLPLIFPLYSPTTEETDVPLKNKGEETLIPAFAAL